jgi:hypothetical protein
MVAGTDDMDRTKRAARRVEAAVAPRLARANMLCWNAVADYHYNKERWPNRGQQRLVDRWIEQTSLSHMFQKSLVTRKTLANKSCLIFLQLQHSDWHVL